jgi:hypothetical protein
VTLGYQLRPPDPPSVSGRAAASSLGNLTIEVHLVTNNVLCGGRSLLAEEFIILANQCKINYRGCFCCACSSSYLDVPSLYLSAEASP